MNVIDLIRKIQERPAMYLNRHSLIALCAFINGWYFRNLEEDTDAIVLEEFQKWLQTENNLDSYRTWDTIIIYLCQDEHQALDYFFKLFEEFLTIRTTLR
jgi:hypothetical protein